MNKEAKSTQNKHRKARPSHRSLTAGRKGVPEPKAAGVDFGLSEPPKSQRPIRPDGWKPKRRSRVSLKLQIPWPRGVDRNRPMRATLVRILRPYKSRDAHCEITRKTDTLAREVTFESIPVGTYVTILQPQGYRPCVGLAKFSRRENTLRPPLLLIPASGPEQEEDLLLPGEEHPFAIHTHKFLSRFGYLKRDTCKCGGKGICEHLSSALRLFQRSYKLAPTGTLTVETFLLMLRPRCAHPDFESDAPERSSTGPPGTTEQDPIVFMPNRWDTFDLLYDLQSGTGDISNEWSIIRKAMKNWADVSPLAFTETNDTAKSHLEFDFRRPSEASYPFDKGGTKDGNTLAHAWGPTDGLVEFDDHEDWGSTSLSAVATHEVGHALGLRHSSVKDATMYAWYDSGQSTLHEVDVRGIKSLYAPVYRHNGPFATYPLFAFQSCKGTDSVTIDLGQTRHFLAWCTVTMIDALVDYDRDNMCFFDIFEVDGARTGWRVAGGDHLGSPSSPGNVHAGTYAGYGRRVAFRLTVGHVADLEVYGQAIVLVLS